MKSLENLRKVLNIILIITGIIIFIISIIYKSLLCFIVGGCSVALYAFTVNIVILNIVMLDERLEHYKNISNNKYKKEYEQLKDQVSILMNEIKLLKEEKNKFDI